MQINKEMEEAKELESELSFKWIDDERLRSELLTVVRLSKQIHQHQWVQSRKCLTKTNTMNTQIKITNKTLFNKRISDIDTSDLASTNYFNGNRHSFCAQGKITINTINNGCIEYWGEHGSRDYEEDFGFVLEAIED